MDTYCDFTELPTLSCSHCTGSKEIASEPWFERGMEIKTFAENLEDEDRVEESNETIQPMFVRTTGIYNKTREVYGGDDNHADFESITEVE